MLESLRHEYELVGKVAEGKTTFLKEYIPYRSALKIYGILGQAMFRKEGKIDKFKKDYLEPINKCAFELGGEELRLEDIDAFPESRYLEGFASITLCAYAAYNFYLGNAETAIDSLKAAVLLDGILEGILFLGGAGDKKLIKKIKKIDKRIKEL